MTVNGDRDHPRHRGPAAAGALPARRRSASPAPTGAATPSNCGTCVVLAGRRARQVAAPCWPRWPTATRSARWRAWSRAASSTPCSRASCRVPRPAVRVLHPGHDDDRPLRCWTATPTRPSARSGRRSPARSAAAPATRTSCARSAGPPSTTASDGDRARDAVEDRSACGPGQGPFGSRPDAAQGGRALRPRPGQLRRRHRPARACCTARSCAARTPTRGSSRSTPRPPRRTRRSRPSSPARRWQR